MKKKITMFWMVLLLVLLSCECTLADNVVTIDSEQYQYTVQADHTARITKYSGSSSELTIPAHLEGYAVGAIGNSAFRGCKSLTSVTIPTGTATIGDYAFEDCAALTSVTLPDSIEQIGSNPFRNCKQLLEINITEDNETLALMDDVLFYTPDQRLVWYPMTKTDAKYVLPEGIQEIGDSAFYRCAGLSNVQLPEGITLIGNHAFYYCKDLTSVTLPESLTAIGDYAFYYCKGLQGITIPKSVATIGMWAFNNCDGMAFAALSEGLKEIGEYAFRNCKGFTSLTLPEGITVIGDYAFWGCSDLVHITMPLSLEQIGKGAFSSLNASAEITFSLGIYEDAPSKAATRQRDVTYLLAESMYQAQDWIRARAEYQKVSGYMNVEKQLKTCDKEIEAAEHEAAIAPYKEISNIVPFGHYEQDNNTDNGKEPIEWIVVDVKSDKALLVSRYVLACQPYNKEFTTTNWENSSLRVWMNGPFVGNAFTAAEQQALVTTTVDNSQIQGYSKFDAKAGNNTLDEVFLLSYTEAGMYLWGDDGCRCQPTKRAALDTYTSSGYCYWWLRSPGSDPSNACFMDYEGEVSDTFVDDTSIGIRPAIWLDLTSDIF